MNPTPSPLLRSELVGTTPETASAIVRPQCASPADIRCRLPQPTLVRILGDVHRALDRDPESALAAAIQLVEILSQPVVRVEPRLRGGLAPWQRKAIDRYMRENLENPLRVAELAAQASLSVSHFCRAFKESFGTTARRHLTLLRLERAQELMLTTADPLSQIALACGMADQAHLSRLFRRVLNESPSAWRRRNTTGAHVHPHNDRVASGVDTCRQVRMG